MMRPLPHVLGVLALLLAGVVTLELRPAAGEDEPALPAGVVVLPPSSSPHLDRSAEWAEVALARPLFNGDRRPLPPHTPGLVAMPKLPRLTGTLIGPFGRHALVVDGNSDKPIALGESDRIGVWKIEAISAGAVTLSSSEGTWNLHVSFKEALPTVTGLQISGAAPRIRRHSRK